ncbi:MAG: AraC family transcriptional regulator [Proteobacteria bacterium]|nr:MAG: AraC family transcriptional regulator [Pseudomonadota bacterium]
MRIAMTKTQWNPRLEKLAERTVAGLNATYTYATANQIPQLWHKFGPMVGKIPGQISEDSFGVVWNEKPGTGFDYLACVRVEAKADLPKDFKQLRLPAEEYAVFTHTGDVSTLPQAFMDVWDNWLPESKWETTGTPSYERYTKDYDPKTQKGGIEFWIPVKAR